MTLKARLLLFFLPLVIIPCVLVFILDLSIFETILQTSAAGSYLYILTGGMCLILLVSIGFVVVLAHFLSTPIKQFTEQAHQVAEGNFDTPMPDDYDNITFEIQQLAAALSRMKVDLKQREAREKEQAAHAAVGKVAAHVAHDLAGPLSSMQTALVYFRRLGASDPRMPDYVNLLELSTTRLKVVSKELLDLHKGEEPQKILFSLHKLLDELIGEYQSNDDYAAVAFVKRYSSRAMSLYADRAKIQRIFGNLTKNAIEAMDKVGRLTIEVHDDDGYAVIQVEDDGCGMSPEILERVVLGGVSHGKQDGHGIGMKVVRETVAEFGGTLEVKSEVGIGTTFIVRLPLPESVQIKEVAREDGIVEHFEIALLPNEPLLVVDDDVALLEQWRLEMEQIGRTTLSCTNYEDFLERGIGSRLTQAAVVDYHFNNSLLKGTEVVRNLKAQGFQRLYLCTAEYWKPSVRKEAGELGVRICPKPLPKVVVYAYHPACPPLAEAQAKDLKEDSSGARLPQNDRDPTSILLIDDDPAMHIAWKLRCKMWGVPHFQAFLSMEDCAKSPINYATIDAAFIDKNIKNSSWALDNTISHLKSLGVKKVWVASGESTKDLQSDPLCAAADGVVKGKMPECIEDYLN